ncbi:MAG: dehydrogenase [Gammaproteobacteria bacterium]|nr:MAG: dehydrogenase [Gammaproteobacteria bacterium]
MNTVSTMLAALPPEIVLTDRDQVEQYCNGIRQVRYGDTPLVLRPRCRDEVVMIVKAAASHGVSLVPHAGNTSYWGGPNPRVGEEDVIVSLERMQAIREIDAENLSMTVEAGAILADVRTAAAEEELLFPLMIGAHQSCRIGGNIGTNAGGVNVLRYGMTRDLVLGLEVVLPDGSVLDALEPLRKDNTGFDVKQLFIGTEGTVGIVTAASLKLSLLPRQTVTAFVSVSSLDVLARLLAETRRECGEQVSSFEYISGHSLRLLQSARPEVRLPIDAEAEHAVLIELTSSSSRLALDDVLMVLLEAAMEKGDVLDAAVAANEQQRAEFWNVRESMPTGEMLKSGKAAVTKHDISVRTSRIARFLECANARVHELEPGIRFSIFGHIGDGNLHYNLLPPEDAGPDCVERIRCSAA